MKVFEINKVEYSDNGEMKLTCKNSMHMKDILGRMNLKQITKLKKILVKTNYIIGLKNNDIYEFLVVNENKEVYGVYFTGKEMKDLCINKITVKYYEIDNVKIAIMDTKKEPRDIYIRWLDNEDYEIEHKGTLITRINKNQILIKYEGKVE